MKERPILFNAPMVRALLDGSKTQTRRGVKPQPTHFNPVGVPRRVIPTGGPSDVIRCPYGQPGDRLWVRETFRGCRAYEVQGYPPKDWGNKPIWFEADGAPPGRPDQWASRSRPSIHMPRWASRITLEVTGVRVELLQDISEADAAAEGARPTLAPLDSVRLGAVGTAKDGFLQIWESINGAGSWDANPFVWVVTFRRIDHA